MIVISINGVPITFFVRQYISLFVCQRLKGWLLWCVAVLHLVLCFDIWKVRWY